MTFTFSIYTKKQFNHTKGYLSADQEHSELRQDHLDEQLNDIADDYQRDIDGTV